MNIIAKKTSPNYRSKMTTERIMFELTLGLLAVSIFAVGYNFTLGTDYGIHALLIILISTLTSVVTEFLFNLLFKKSKDLKAIRLSFPWVTGIIFALTLPVGTPYYVVVVGAFISIFFGKMVYGGFGQNVFNPALVGRVVVHLSFGSQLVTTLGTDVASGATPLTEFASTNFMGEIGTSLSDLFTGLYGGALGETSALVILVVGLILAYRRVFDYRIPVAYIGTAAVLALVQTLIGGLPLENVLAHVCMGGLMFGAIFMATDPVTSPTSPMGKIIFGIGLGCITMLIRFKANFPEGVLFSILIMNMFTPLIDNLTMGRTTDHMVKKYVVLAVLALVSVGTIAGISTTLELPEEPEEEVAPPRNPVYNVVSGQGNVFVVESEGFSPTQLMKIEVTLDKDARMVQSVKVLDYAGETAEFGKDMIEQGQVGYLRPAAQVMFDKVLNSSFSYDEVEGIDVHTGATLTAEGIMNAVNKAIETYDQLPAKSEDGVYEIDAVGFNPGSPMKVKVTLDGDMVSSVEVLSYAGETEGFGKDLIEVGQVGYLKPAAQTFHDTVLKGSFAVADASGIDTSTGATITAKGIMNAVTQAIIANNQ